METEMEMATAVAEDDFTKKFLINILMLQFGYDVETRICIIIKMH